jgi:hypothetical protein
MNEIETTLQNLDATPRVDAAEVDISGAGVTVTTKYVRADFARDLERQLNISRAVNRDDCCTDTICRDAARPLLGEWVDGDKWGVPLRSATRR